MIFFVLRRSIFAIVLLMIVSAFTFWIFSALPSDPAALTCGKNCRPEVIEANRIRLGYDKPIIEQYGGYMKGIFTGRTYGEEGASIHCSAPSLGYSYDRHECVTTLIAKTLPVTASIAVGAFTLWILIGVGLGTLAALKRGKWQDRVATGFSVIGVSFPTFFSWVDINHGVCDLDGVASISPIQRHYRESLEVDDIIDFALVCLGSRVGSVVCPHDS